ncbi:DUF2332 domain-containing protein [Sphingomonas oligophenolica]|uniref:DUF2332 domain-containing protein n=1 Tax=Sphingomonas oligophenolica TaxID=301154 RepID=A0ABU9YB32_9SPHN
MVDHAPAVFPLMRGREGLLRWNARRRDTAPFYAAMSLAIAEDEELYEISEEAAEGQLSGRLMLSAVHYLLLQNPHEPLARYCPSIAQTPLPADDVGPVMKEFCRKYRSEIIDILHHRTLQTTATDRAARVLLALNEVAKAIGEPFTLFEVGCSAGILLLFDHYRYEFGNGASLGPADASTTVSSFNFVGDRPALPTQFPPIKRRIGFDLDPVNVANADERNWILGCIVADRVDEFEGMRRSLEYRASVPLEVVTGDAMQTLPNAFASIDGPVCILHSWCLYQWPPAAQEAFDTMLTRLSQTRTIHRVGIEATEKSTERAGIEIFHTVYRNGDSETRLLGHLAEGEQLHWYA